LFPFVTEHIKYARLIHMACEVSWVNVAGASGIPVLSDIVIVIVESETLIASQAVSRWLPTAAARVQARVSQVGYVVDKIALGQVFPEYLGFPCQFSFHQILHHQNPPGQVQ
jgi:hypothetical protein